MNSPMSWSVKGIEPEVREAAKLAARRSGQTLGQWLNAMILGTADGLGLDDHDYSASMRTPGRKAGGFYENRIEHLEHELAQLTRRQTDTAMKYRHGAGAVADTNATPLNQLLERLDLNERQTVRAFETLHERLSKLSRDLDETKSEVAGRTDVEATSSEHEAFESALRNVVDHIESADKENRDILAELNTRLEDLSHEVAAVPKGADSANRKILGDVEHRLTTLAHRVDQIAQADDGDLKKDIEGQLSRLAKQVEQIALSPSGEVPAEIDERLAELAHRVDVAERIASQSHTELNESLEHRLAQLGQRLESVREASCQTAEQAASAAVQSTQEDFREIETQVRNLAAQFQTAVGLDPETEQVITDLMQQMSEISQDVQQIKVEAATENDLQSLRSGLDNLSHMMEQKFANATHDEAFAALEKRLSEVGQRLERSIEAPAPDSQIENLERRVHEIDARLAASQGDSRTEELVQALGAQIDGLAQRVANSEQQYSGIQAIEKSIAQLFESVEQTRHFASEAAEQAAGRVVEQMRASRDSENDSTTLQALEQGLQALKSSAEGADRRNQETLEAVHDTLEKVITRLVALEDATGDRSPTEDRSADETLDLPPLGNGLDDLKLPPIPPIPSPHGFQSGARNPGEPSWKAAVDAKSAEQMEELFADTAPQLPRLGDATPDGLVSPDAPPAAGDNTSRRNDFIAAARRAAQAAAEVPEPQAGSGPFSALRKAKRTKKSSSNGASKKRRPLILAAIVLLMIGAASAYKVIGDKKNAADPAPASAPPASEVAPPAEIDPPTKTTPETDDAPSTAEPERQSRATPPVPRSDPRSPAVEEPMVPRAVTTTTGPGKQSLDVPSPGTTPVSPKSDTLTTGSVKPTGRSTEVPDTSLTDSVLLTMPWLQPPTTKQPATKQPAKPAPTKMDAKSEASDAASTAFSDPAPAIKRAESLPPPKDLPPAEVGPMELRVAAANGDPVAQFMVALAYTDGKTVEQDFRVAAQWYQKAAARGLAPAQYRLATFYEKGKGLPQDVAAARIWYERAAEKGNRKAMHNLAVIYADGSRANPDFDKAGIWFRNAAELGLKDSQYNLGILHERGLGVAKDLGEAYKWFSLAAKQGDQDAETRLHRIESRLAPQALIQAKLDVENWTVKASDKSANVVTPPANGWQSAAAEPTSRIYASRENIAVTQALLNTLGYSAGPSDGYIGERTRTAIRDFQKANGMALTGEVSGELLSALRQKTG